MIESRYKIEYVLPDDDVKKSSSFKVLWYLLLIPLILFAVTMITYDFSVKNITRDSLVLVEKAKVHIFNLGETSKKNKPEKVIDNVVVKTVKPTPSKLTTSTATAKVQETTEAISKIAPISEIKVKPVNSDEQILIGELTAKQELQQKTLQEQLSKNTELNEYLNAVSNQLELEKSKNESLNSKLSEQDQDRLELEEQLNKALAESENNEVTIEELTEKKEQPSIVSKESNDADTIKTVESLDKVNSLEIEKVSQSDSNDKSSDNVISPNTEVAPIKSETDKIIEAMTSINTTSNQTSENEDTNTKLEELTKSNDTIDKKLAIKIEVTDTKISSSPKIVEEIERPVAALETTKEAVVNETTPLIIVNKVTEAEKIVETEKEPTPKANSSVDEIIAAMEASQPKAPEDTSDSNQNIDKELEKEIKQQLVEKGAISVDN